MRETDSLLVATENNAVRTKYIYIKAKIDNEQKNSRLCGDRE